MIPEIKPFFHEDTFTVAYVVADPQARKCVIIDPSLDFDFKSGNTATAFVDSIVDYIRARNYRLDYILETHAHADHLTAAPYLKAKLGGNIAIGAHIVDVQKIFKKLLNLGPEFNADGSQFDILLDDDEIIELGALSVRVMHTPGHTPACLTYVIGDCAFVGDTLFMPDYGTARTDFPGGASPTLYRSIQKILSLPPKTKLYMCHDYKAPGRDHFSWETTVAAQKAYNIHVHDGINEEDFVAMRDARDKTLEVPMLLLPSIQVNIRAGEFPPPESNGVSYLKIPLNQLG